MSGIIGHTMYAILAGKAAEHRRLPIVPIVASGLSQAAEVVVRLEPVAPSSCVRGAVA